MRKPRLSQHFLRDSTVIERILRAAALGPADQVLEIGPGEGVLTLPMARRVKRVVACEIDPRLAQRLPRHPNLEVRQGDFLAMDLSDLEGTWKVVANLPYAITSPILEKLLALPTDIPEMWLMVQKEVADRVAARRSRDTGALTIFVQLRADAEVLFTVPPMCFDPPPEVDSAILHLTTRPLPQDVNHKRLGHLVRAAFQQRRKMLKRSLGPLLGPEAETHLRNAGIDPTQRPETLAWEDFVRLERVSR